MLDYTGVVGGFLFWSPKGQLFALKRFVVSRDFSRILPQVASANFHVAYPLFSRMTESNINLVLHPTQHAHAYFLMDIKAGPTKKTVKVFQESSEIIGNAIASRKFPVIHFGELQKAVMASRRNQSPISIRIRFLELRPNLPKALRDAATDIFVANADPTGNKEARLEYKLATVDRELRRAMVENYLVKCLWLNPITNHLGMMTCNDQLTGFSKFISGDADVTAFERCLARDEEGRYRAQTGIANVLPAMLPHVEWNSPSVHIYDEVFRNTHRLQEYYSLYAGFKALCAVGPPVLVHESYELPAAVPVRLLRPREASPATLIGMREFPTRHLVWDA
ncbi:MAG: hypothetical protein BMS9Abin01_2641 [Gammaproteobacteria bacterium]|nr:MAG: hypothetical protein BMS9Abin01_2641 [Gammaproteobacteria bacterium]